MQCEAALQALKVQYGEAFLVMAEVSNLSAEEYRMIVGIPR